MERWDKTGRHVVTANLNMGVDQLPKFTETYVEIPDTGAADSLITVRHGLGRIPRGLRVVRAVLPTTNDFSWYSLVTDSAWTDSQLNFRVRPANSRIMIEVF